MRVNNVQAYRGAGLAGLGLIQAGLPSLEPFLASGELIEILPDPRAASLPVPVVVAHRQNLSRRVRIFMEWLEQALRADLDR